MPESASPPLFPGERERELTVGGNLPSRLSIYESESSPEQYFTIIEVRYTDHDISTLASSPLSDNSFEALLRFLQGAELLGSSSEINKIYFDNVRRQYNKLGDDPRYLQAIQRQLISDLTNLSNESVSELQLEFFTQSEADEVIGFVANPANQAIARSLVTAELQNLGAGFSEEYEEPELPWPPEELIRLMSLAGNATYKVDALENPVTVLFQLGLSLNTHSLIVTTIL